MEWNRYYTLDIDETEWVQVWNNVHNNLLSFEIQSTIWTMLHLNLYCGYKEKLFNYGEGICKLFGEVEEGSHHIITECEVMKACINDYHSTLLSLRGDIISKDELAFGLVGDPIGEMSPKLNLGNFITLTIRHVVFKNRHMDFGGKESAKVALKNRIKHKIKKQFINKWIEYRAKHAQDECGLNYLVGA